MGKNIPLFIYLSKWITHHQIGLLTSRASHNNINPMKITCPGCMQFGTKAPSSFPTPGIASALLAVSKNIGAISCDWCFICIKRDHMKHEAINQNNIPCIVLCFDFHVKQCQTHAHSNEHRPAWVKSLSTASASEWKIYPDQIDCVLVAPS